MAGWATEVQAYRGAKHTTRLERGEWQDMPTFWRARCRCGYESPPTTEREMAEGSARRHVARVKDKT